MKTIKKILGSLLACAAILPLLYSCTDEVEYTPAEPVDGPQAYFDKDAPSTVELSTDEDSFDVTIYRVNTDEAVSFTLEVSDTSGLFTIPTAVSFAAGQESTTLTIGYSYNEDDFPYDTYHGISLTIPDEYSTPYAVPSYEFKAGVASSWVSLGMCTYRDDFITTIFAVDNYEYEVEIEENQTRPGLFRLVYPYDGKYPENEEYDDGTADWDLDDTYYLEINAEDPDGVYIEMQDLGMDWGYGHFWVWSMADYYYQNGYTWDVIKAAGYCGTYDGEIITFPTATLLCTMPDYYGWSFYTSNNNGMFRVAMPGVVLKDYSVDVEYTGKYLDDNWNNQAVAKVTLGEDVASADVVLVANDDRADALDALVAGGEFDYLGFETITESGNVAFDCNEAGRYAIIAVTYDEDGNAKEANYVAFNFSPDLEETWHKYGTGAYEYTMFFADYDYDTGETIPYTDEGLTLWQSDEDETRFKISDWGYGVDFTFTWNQTTNEVYVDDQYTGYYYSYYGKDVYVDEIDDWNGGWRYQSYYDDGVFNFCIIYYMKNLGYFDYGYETFTLDPETWTEYGTCDYEYSLFFFDDYVYDDDGNPVQDEYGNYLIIPYLDEGLTILQSDLDETRFKISDWGYGVNFIFTWDQETNEVYVENQKTGASMYGSVWVDEMDNWYKNYGGWPYQSYYDDGVFNFYVVYYDNYYYYGYGYETCVLHLGGDDDSGDASTTGVKPANVGGNVLNDRKFDFSHVKITKESKRSDKTSIALTSLPGTKLNFTMPNVRQANAQIVKGQSMSVATHKNLDMTGAQQLTAKPEKIHKK